VKKIASAHDVFWLARHAHNTLDPLFKEARQSEPTIHFILNLNFAAEHPVYKADSLGIMGHWDKEGMFIFQPRLHTPEDVAKVAAKIQEFICSEQAATVATLQPLEVGIPA
jgi:hypothetical protein